MTYADIVSFNNNISSDFKNAYAFIHAIEEVELHVYDIEPPYDDEETDFNKEKLVDTITLIKLKLCFAFESLGLVRMLDSLNKDFEKHESKLAELHIIRYLDVMYSAPLQTLQQYSYALISHLNIANSTENSENNISLLERILRGTPKLISDRGVSPENEADVRNEVYKTLIHVFPDTVREIPISKISKTYKPDIGIRKLKCAIEYKFIDSLSEAKSSIGGVFEDIQGYAGSNDWKAFYAIFYMTDNFFTSDQIEHEFRLSEAPHNWKPIVVIGRGGRPLKKNVLKPKPNKKSKRGKASNSKKSG